MKTEAQQIKDHQHLINSRLNEFLIMLKEGSKTNIEQAKIKAKSDFLKFGTEMQKLAERLGGEIEEKVEAYLDSVDAIVHTVPEFIDEAIIADCFKASEILERDLAA